MSQPTSEDNQNQMSQPEDNQMEQPEPEHNELQQYYNRFKHEQITVNDQQLNICNLFLPNCSAYHIALAILAECSCLKMSSSQKDQVLYMGYQNIITNSKTIVSVLSIAQQIVLLCDQYYQSEFIHLTLLRNIRFSPPKYNTNGDENKFFNHYERRETLETAGFKQLVKALRLYVTETTKRLFAPHTVRSDWTEYDATYISRQGQRRTSNSFNVFVKSLLSTYDTITLLSPSLHELSTVLKNVAAASKVESQARREAYIQQKQLERNLAFQQKKEMSKDAETDENKKPNFTNLSRVKVGPPPKSAWGKPPGWEAPQQLESQSDTPQSDTPQSDTPQSDTPQPYDTTEEETQLQASGRKIGVGKAMHKKDDNENENENDDIGFTLVRTRKSPANANNKYNASFQNKHHKTVQARARS